MGIRLVAAPRNSTDDWKPEGPNTDRSIQAVVDTGAPVTVPPFEFWNPFASDIESLAMPDPDSDFLIGGGAQKGQFGRIRLGAIDDNSNWMRARWTFAILLDAVDSQDPSALRLPLLGLQSHFFQRNRRIRHVGSVVGDDLETIPQWRLEDPPRWRPW
jgi:hypothetical protein